MAYYAVGDRVVDFSNGSCGPGMYKWHPNGTCQAAPSWADLPLPEVSHSDSPPTLPGGNVGWGNQVSADFSGGSCGAGMIRPGPDQPCQQIQQGTVLGGFEDGAASQLIFKISLLGGLAYLAYKALKK